MKNLFLVAIIALSTIITADAQSLRPRFGIVPSEDNTYRALQISYNTVKDKSGVLDTIRLYPNSYLNYVQNTMKDSCVYAIKSNTQAYFGDRITIHVTNTSAVTTRHLYFATGLPKYQPILFEVGAADSVNTVAVSKDLIATFEFNGVSWVEIGMVK